MYKLLTKSSKKIRHCIYKIFDAVCDLTLGFLKCQRKVIKKKACPSLSAGHCCVYLEILRQQPQMNTADKEWWEKGGS